MVPLELSICIIVVQCLWNLLSIAALSKENRGKDKVIETLSNQLREKDEVISNLAKKLGGR